jgi:hypothetical protein
MGAQRHQEHTNQMSAWASYHAWLLKPINPLKVVLQSILHDSIGLFSTMISMCLRTRGAPRRELRRLPPSYLSQASENACDSGPNASHFMYIPYIWQESPKSEHFLTTSLEEQPTYRQGDGLFKRGQQYLKVVTKEGLSSQISLTWSLRASWLGLHLIWPVTR